jgi:hypothetical protein
LNDKPPKKAKQRKSPKGLSAVVGVQYRVLIDMLLAAPACHMVLRGDRGSTVRQARLVLRWVNRR